MFNLVELNVVEVSIVMALNLDESYVKQFVCDEEISNSTHLIKAAHEALHNKTGPGADFLGWLNLPSELKSTEIDRIEAAAEKIKSNSEVLVVIGIGGSYLGPRAVIEALKSSMHNIFQADGGLQIFYVGNSISSTHLNNVLKICANKSFSINVISKSGTTTEPALAFRFFKNLLEKKVGKEEAKSRIFCTTDSSKGKLKELADENGYEQFVIPDDVGGRFSVLTAVGLLPIAAAGLNIRQLLDGAKRASFDFNEFDLKTNYCYRYAAIRNILLKKNKKSEMLVSFEPELLMFNEWFKQLFGESEGKNDAGILPTSAIFSTDLHSLGQYIQDGSKILFETFIKIKKSSCELFIEQDETNFDGLNYLSNQNVSCVNEMAFKGTVLAHSTGGVPCIVLEIEELNEFNLGYLIYFFEKACAISGYMLGVNPFNQPGVEAYKNNMFALLKKPGYEELTKKLIEKI